MYKTGRQAADFIEQLIPKIEGCHAQVLLAVPFTAIAASVAAARQSKIEIGAQNMNDAHEGAFTGEIAALMLKEAGARFVLLGHSERRRFFGETDAMIHRKVLRAFEDDLQPVLCIGETAQEHQEHQTEKVLHHQLKTALAQVQKEALKSLILAYEPVWAIGTGETASPAKVQAAHTICRTCLEELFGTAVAQAIPILYGGSVKAEQVKNLLLNGRSMEFL